MGEENDCWVYDLSLLNIFKSVADPGFPVGGREPHRGGVDSRGSYVSKTLYVEMKESGPLWGEVRRANPIDLPMRPSNMS